MAEISKGKKFNMWSTNGRRSDIINAITIYLSVLNDLEREMPGEKWERYPNSIKQYEFYRRAVELSSDVLTEHAAYDQFIKDIEPVMSQFLNKDKGFVQTEYPKYKDTLDTYIEARARYYTDNLVKLGFVSKQDRKITPAGAEFLNGVTARDRLEKILPISDLNLILLRQIMKLRIYTKFPKNCKEGKYYSPFFMAAWLLLFNDNVDRDIFKELVLNSSPFEPVKISTDIIKSVKKPGSGQTVDIPEAFKTNELIDKDVFSEHVTMRKSAEKYKDIYYNFYQAMYNLFTDSALTKENYKALTDIIYGSDRSAIRSGFLINAPLNTGNKSRILSLDNFKRKNAQSEWFNDSIPFNEQFYTQYVLSSSINLTKEYSDTLLRLFSATGIFNFNGALPEMLYGELFSTVFTRIDIESLIFDDTTAWGYENYEGGTNSFYGNHTTLTEILKLENNDVDTIITELHEKYGADDIQSTLMGIKRERMKEHVKDKYPKDKIIELLSYVSDRNNDEHIKKYINSGANVPTIYEYIVTIAWYYISGEDFSILDSFNLELNGNFEPLRHAAGGQGDIEIFYDDGRVVMLEVTLMNKQAQKRGEWEPVLRHSINLKADNEDKETTTLFIADELDNNSINIWRAVASVPLEASSSGKETDKVFIMPFTNKEIIGFLTDNISGKRIIQSVRDSFEHMDFLFDKEWRNKILNSI